MTPKKSKVDLVRGLINNHSLKLKVASRSNNNKYYGYLKFQRTLKE